MSSKSDQSAGLPPHHPPPSRQSTWRYRSLPNSESLRKRYRGWVFPVTIAALIWYLAYVLLAAYAPDFMAQPLWGNINVGLVLGLLQFVTTFVITGLYIRYAGRVLDPASTRIREKMEKEGLA